MHRLTLLIAIAVAGCSAESAPSNAAGSVKQAPSLQQAEAHSINIEGAQIEAQRVPNSNGPKCKHVTKETCSDSSRQKMCSCNGPMNMPDTYPCGCSAETKSGAVGIPEVQAAGG